MTDIMSEKYHCGECEHYTGNHDFDLCCTLEHPGYTLGFLCYGSTPACKDFKLKSSIAAEPYDYFHETMNIKN